MSYHQYQWAIVNELIGRSQTHQEYAAITNPSGNYYISDWNTVPFYGTPQVVCHNGYCTRPTVEIQVSITNPRPVEPTVAYVFTNTNNRPWM